MEVWLPVIGFEKSYEVSNFGRIRTIFRTHPNSQGRIRNIRSHVLKTPSQANGYCRAVLQENGRKVSIVVHRVVAEAFIPNPENKAWVNHKDGNKANNAISNLEWSTPSENHIHARKMGLYVAPKGEASARAKLNKQAVLEIRDRYIPRSPSNRLLAEKFNVGLDMISKVATGRLWSHI